MIGNLIYYYVLSWADSTQDKSNNSKKNNIDMDYTELMRAAKNGNFHQVKFLLNQNNAEEQEKEKSLLLAAHNGHLKIVELLLKDAYIGYQNQYGHTALMLAASSGHLRTVKLLLKKSYNVNENHQIELALMFAAQNGHFKVVKFLLARGVDINYKSQRLGYHDKTALIVAASSGHLKIVTLLLEKNADNGSSEALILASENGHFEVVKVLSDEFRKNDDYEKKLTRSLFGAAYHGQIEIFKFLFDKCSENNYHHPSGYLNILIESRYLDNYNIHERFNLIKAGFNISDEDFFILLIKDWSLIYAFKLQSPSLYKKILLIFDKILFNKKFNSVEVNNLKSDEFDFSKENINSVAKNDISARSDMLFTNSNSHSS